MLQPSASTLSIAPIGQAGTLRNQAYATIKRSILAMDLYDGAPQIRLEEHQLARDLGVSRTPIREALTLLEQEGLVFSVPRRGIFVARKTKRELIEMITVWAALEGTAAHLAADRASDAELAGLSALFRDFTPASLPDHLNEYAHVNIAFHQAIVGLGGCGLMVEMTANLFLHVRAIRTVSIHQGGRAERSMTEHAAIVAALQARDAERAAILVRDHALGLAAHVDAHWAQPEA
ncbi:GntR family transcriptional regulator [Methylobacterium planeticum]|uniref:GntR family transcriptional regulator n=1 Tax=Methylobacterium planeticum TaxID=2615211 RepID=A0A6N6MS55_9HYPH|nr:GntR family transcriptional regulator [Methylobacterium planeticum]KAB1073286.1 GntR family transcriptional regulator [Methylobacterium planeticum]